MPEFDPSRLYAALPSFWRDAYQDRDKLVRLWDALLRVMDDEWAQVEQINDASSVDSCPAFIYHTYVNRTLENWQSYGLPHVHFRKDFRSTAAQTIFYVGGWPDPTSSRVYVDGKETDNVSDPYVITLTEDGTQPSINPAGARLIFDSPRVLNTPISLFSDRDLYHTETEIPDAGLTEITFPAVIDPTSVKLVIKKLKMYDGSINNTTLTITGGTTVSWFKSDPTASDTRVFRAGEVFEVRDGTTIQTVSLEEDATSFEITAVTPATTLIYKIVDLDITDGKIELSGFILRSSGQNFPVASRVRIEDEFGSESVVVEEPADALEFPRSFGEATVFSYGGHIIDAYTVDDNTITFPRTFQPGLVLLIEASFYVSNDHAEYHEVTTSLTDEITVPATRPFALTAGLLEDPQFPIQVYIDNVLLPPDNYTFLSSKTIIKLVAPLILPIGTRVDIYYVDQEEPEPHRHLNERFPVANPQQAFEMAQPVEPRFTQHVTVDGILVSSPSLRWFTPDGKFLNFFYPIPGGSIVRVSGAKESYSFYHEIDADLIRADYLQDGIDELSTQIPNGWTIQLVWGIDFTIISGILEANQLIEDAWFVNALVDEKTGYSNFGELIDFNRDTSDEYMRILRALFAGSFMGSQPQTIENFVNIILGSEYLDTPSQITSISGTTIRVGDTTYTADAEVPIRVRAKESYEKFYAVSSFADIIDDWTSFDLMAIMAEEFSADYRFAKTLDRYEVVVREGGEALYDRDLEQIKDTTQDFHAWEVWPGDLIGIYPTWSPTTPVYGRIRSVGRETLGITLDLGTASIAYGEGWFGQYTYGGTAFEEQIDHYKIWARQTRRLDTYEFLDQARVDEIPYLSDRFANLFGQFIFLVKFHWAAMRSGQAIEDVNTFLNRTRPHDTNYIGYVEAYDEDGLSDTVVGDISDAEPEREIIADFLFVSNSSLFGGRVGEDGQISPNVGSFIGIEIIP